MASAATASDFRGRRGMHLRAEPSLLFTLSHLDAETDCLGVGVLRGRRADYNIKCNSKKERQHGAEVLK
jgi:hypothetical protein